MARVRKGKKITTFMCLKPILREVMSFWENSECCQSYPQNHPSSLTRTVPLQWFHSSRLLSPSQPNPNTPSQIYIPLRTCHSSTRKPASRSKLYYSLIHSNRFLCVYSHIHSRPCDSRALPFHTKYSVCVFEYLTFRASHIFVSSQTKL